MAQYPFRTERTGLDSLDDMEATQLIRRSDELDLAVEEGLPNVALVDTTYPEGMGFAAISEILALSPDVGVLALTAAPPSHEDVARAMKAGALGFIDAAATPSDFANAVRSARAGVTWLPEDETRQVLARLPTISMSRRRSADRA